MTDSQEAAEHLHCPICGVLPLPENPHRDRELVAHLYYHHKLTQSEVSDAIGCSRTTLRKWMDKFDINRRTGRGSRSRKLTIDSDEVPCPICESPDLPENAHRYEKILSHLYQDHFLTISEVSNELDSSEHAVRRWMNESDIEIRSGGTKYKIQENKLRNLYINKELSPNEIADQFGCSHTVIRDRLEEYGIEIRDNTGADEINLDTDTVPCPLCQSPSLPDKPYRSSDILDHLYNNHELIQEEIADMFDVSRTTIKTWFSRLDISGTEYEYEIPEAELRELYCDDKKSIEDIADFYGCSYLAVRNRLQNYGIEIRSSHEMIVDADDTSYRDKEWLKTQYNKKDKSRQVIADECGVSESTIQHWMNKFGIEARSLSDAQEQRALRRDLDYMNEELLRELYWVEEMTQRQIADELGATQGAVQIWMNHHDIDIRYAGAHGQTYETKRGEYVRSSPERTIANWLYENGIDYEYEPDPDSIDLRPDFLIEGDLVEYWGMLGREEYVDRMHEKLDRYDSAGVEIVSLFPHHLSKLDAKLSQYL